MNETNSPPRLKTKTYTGELKANKSRKQKTTELNGGLRKLTELNGKESMREQEEKTKRHALTTAVTHAVFVGQIQLPAFFKLSGGWKRHNMSSAQVIAAGSWLPLLNSSNRAEYKILSGKYILTINN